MIITTNTEASVQVSMTFKGGDGNYDGYNYGDYFPKLNIHQDFASKEEAQEELEAAYLGADCDGVGVEWEIQSDEEGNMTTATYLIDYYFDGSQWGGFTRASTLEEAKAMVLRKFPDASPCRGNGYNLEEANEEGRATLVAGFEIDSTDYADIYEIA